MCHLQTILFKCRCIGSHQLHPCSLFPEMRDNASDCPSFGKTCEEIVLSYCCDKQSCASRTLLREEREKRERLRQREEREEKRRARAKACYERWKNAWVQEGMSMGEEERLSSESKKYVKEMRLLMEDKGMEEQASRKLRDDDRQSWEFWENTWMQDGMTGQKAVQLLREKTF